MNSLLKFYKKSMEKWEYEKIEVEDQKIVCFTYDKHWHRCRNNKCAHKVKEKV